MNEEQQARAVEDMIAFLSDFSGALTTELAEHAALEQNHDEWLDNPDHKIWDIAFDIWSKHQ